MGSCAMVEAIEGHPEKPKKSHPRRDTKDLEKAREGLAKGREGGNSLGTFTLMFLVEKY